MSVYNLIYPPLSQLNMENQIYENICLRRNANKQDVYRAVLGKIALAIESHNNRGYYSSKTCEDVISQITAILEVNSVDVPTD